MTCRKRLMAYARKPDGETRIRILLTTQGWGNCANAYGHRHDEVGARVKVLRDSIAKRFDAAYGTEERCVMNEVPRE